MSYTHKLITLQEELKRFTSDKELTGKVNTLNQLLGGYRKKLAELKAIKTRLTQKSQYQAELAKNKILKEKLEKAKAKNERIRPSFEEAHAKLTEANAAAKAEIPAWQDLSTQVQTLRTEIKTLQMEKRAIEKERKIKITAEQARQKAFEAARKAEIRAAQTRTESKSSDMSYSPETPTSPDSSMSTGTPPPTLTPTSERALNGRIILLNEKIKGLQTHISKLQQRLFSQSCQLSQKDAYQFHLLAIIARQKQTISYLARNQKVPGEITTLFYETLLSNAKTMPESRLFPCVVKMDEKDPGVFCTNMAGAIAAATPSLSPHP